MKKGYIYIVLFLCFTTSIGRLSAQDMHFTQFFSSQLYLNPAFTGADVCSRLSGTYRNQWPGVSKAYRSYLFSFDHYLQSQNLGVGLLFGSDVAGSGDLKTTIINPSIAYEAVLTKKIIMRVGFQPGLGIRSINYDKLIFGDQIARGGNVATIEDPSVTKAYFDISSGVLIYTQKYWFGASFFHLNKPNQSMLPDGESFLPVKYSAHGGYKYSINEEEKDEFKIKSASFVFNYRGQRKFDQLDVGVYYTQYIFNLGLWYRGIPLLKAYKDGYSNNDALAFIVGVKADRFNIGYSYDFTISKLTNATMGAHEVCVAYQFCKLKKKKKKRLLVPCPKF